MLPSAYEFHWDPGHIVFLGVFYGVVTLVVVSLGVALHHWLGDVRQRRVSRIDWEETFHDLPRERRHCRHEFDGAVGTRICQNCFECDTCADHAALAAAAPAVDEPPPPGVDLPADRLYHRGHTWVRARDDGTVDVGLDDLAVRCFGQADRLMLPAAGSVLLPGTRGATIGRGPLRARILSPVAGEVLETGDLTGGRLYRLQPTGDGSLPGNLLRGAEARVWMLREMESLQQLLDRSPDSPTLADGGEAVPDLMLACPDADWDDIWGHVCLEA